MSEEYVGPGLEGLQAAIESISQNTHQVYPDTGTGVIGGPLVPPVITTTGRSSSGIGNPYPLIGIAMASRAKVISAEFEEALQKVFPSTEHIFFKDLIHLWDDDLLFLAKAARLTADDSWKGAPLSVGKITICLALCELMMPRQFYIHR